MIIEIKKSVSPETPRYGHTLWSPSSCCAISCAFIDSWVQ